MTGWGRAKALVLAGVGLVLSLFVLAAGEGRDGLTIIANREVTVGLQPELGGRIVHLSFAGGRNLIPRSPRPWSWRPEGWPRPPLNYSWSQDFGAVVWTGPQDSWWTNHRQAREPYNPGWPPDPDWTLAAFHVIEQSRSRIVMQSPVSRLSGLQLVKTVECLPDGEVRVTAQMCNRGTRALTRDLWFVFRAPYGREEFVPVRSVKDVRLLKPAGSRILQGQHTLLPPKATQKSRAAFNKAFIEPEAGRIAVAYPQGFLLLDLPRARVSKGHAPIEIYRLKNADGTTLLELEQHSKAVRLRPGESYSATQSWRFVRYTGARTAVKRSNFLAGLMSRMHRCAYPAR